MVVKIETGVVSDTVLISAGSETGADRSAVETVQTAVVMAKSCITPQDHSVAGVVS